MTCATCSHRWLGKPSADLARRSGVAMVFRWWCRTGKKPLVEIGNNNDLRAATGCKEWKK